MNEPKQGEPQWTHFDPDGRARMVDVSAKAETHRQATASAVVTMDTATLAMIKGAKHAKGDVLQVARLAGIMAAKRTDSLIPLCHSLPLASVTVDFQYRDNCTLEIRSTTGTVGRTGVEMEALVAVSTAALTVYDMCKAVDRGMMIGSIQLEEKIGGKSGHWTRK